MLYYAEIRTADRDDWTAEIDAEDDNKASMILDHVIEDECDEIERSDQFPSEGALLTVEWILYREGSVDNPVEIGQRIVVVEPNHEILIDRALDNSDKKGKLRICGLHPDDHCWTSRGEEGDDGTPGRVKIDGNISMKFSHAEAVMLSATPLGCFLELTEVDLIAFISLVRLEVGEAYCQCCGSIKFNIFAKIKVNGGAVYNLSLSCASFLATGSRSHESISRIHSACLAADIAQRMLDRGDTPLIVASHIFDRFKFSARVVGDTVDLGFIGSFRRSNLYEASS